MFLFSVLSTKAFSFILLLLGSEGVAFGVYEVKRSLTPFGWAAVIILPTPLIFGAVYFLVKFLKKIKLK